MTCVLCLQNLTEFRPEKGTILGWGTINFLGEYLQCGGIDLPIGLFSVLRRGRGNRCVIHFQRWVNGGKYPWMCRLKIVVRMVVGKSRAMRPGSVACNVFIKNGECLFV